MGPVTKQATVRGGQKQQGKDLSMPRLKVHPQILCLDLSDYYLFKKKSFKTNILNSQPQTFGIIQGTTSKPIYLIPGEQCIKRHEV